MRYRISRLAALTITVMFGFVFNAEALSIHNYNQDPTKWNRFISGYPSAPVNNTNFFAASYDWSGVGWQSGMSDKSVAMISPLHFVAANHHRPSGNLTFFNPDDELKSYAIDSSGYSTMIYSAGIPETSDLVLGKLSAAIPDTDNVTYYPVLWFDDEDDYLDMELYVYGKTALAGTNTLDAIVSKRADDKSNLTYCFGYDYDYVTGEAGGVSGDSGSPTFIPWGSQLTVLGTKFAVSGGDHWTTYDSFIPYYHDQLNSAMSGSGYQVTLVPEPSVFLLLAGGMMFCWLV